MAFYTPCVESAHLNSTITFGGNLNDILSPFYNHPPRDAGAPFNLPEARPRPQLGSASFHKIHIPKQTGIQPKNSHHQIEPTPSTVIVVVVVGVGGPFIEIQTTNHPRLRSDTDGKETAKFMAEYKTACYTALCD